MTVIVGSALDVLKTLPDQHARCCVTSPPYWGLRDYGTDGQIGLEETPEAYVENLVGIFREVRRVLSDDGTLWLNLGDSYARNGGDGPGGGNRELLHLEGTQTRNCTAPAGLKPKDMVGIPWRVAFALQADGWYLRSDIIWAKPNPMPESVTDRPTKSHEYVFLMSKSPRYFWDAAAIKDAAVWAGTTGCVSGPKNAARAAVSGRAPSGNEAHGAGRIPVGDTRNARTVWEIATKPYAKAHFATMPVALAERCVLAGSEQGDTVLDPFTGAGTTRLAAHRHGRSFVGAELNPDFAKMARQRSGGVQTQLNIEP